MLKTLFPVLAFILFSLPLAAQNEIILKSDKGLYIEHKVAAKENYYSIGRRYNAGPKDIAAYNKLDMNKGLNIGQVLRIPLTSTNFSQTVNSGTPVYYKTGDKESLAKISSKSNNVPVDNLRYWNALETETAPGNAKLIIGFLLSPELPSVTINNKINKSPVTPVLDEKINPPPPREIIIEELKKDEPRKEPVVVKEIKPEVKSPGVSNTGEGYFKTSFDQQVRSTPVTKSETVAAGIFKTTSGWNDGKYYVLIDGVKTGTIVKIINPDNNKAVYAKVLGEISSIRQNEGLTIRMSNAAASMLQVNEQDKFVVKINY
jgi:hypothetical protein